MSRSSVLQLPCQVYCSRFSPSRAQQLVGFGGKDGALYVYPFGEYSRTARLEGDVWPVTAIVFDPQQRHVVGGSDGGGVRLWDISTEQLVRSFGSGHKSTVTGIDYHCFTDYIATCSRDKSLRIWDTRKKTCLQSYKNASAALCATQFSPSGRWAASGCAEGIIRIYDLVSGRQLNEVKAHSGAVTSICFHPELYYMAVGSSDGTVSLWEVENFTKVFQTDPLDTPVDAVHLFGKKMLLAADHVLRAYDFTLMSDQEASVIEAPWNIIGDLTYSSVSDEAWYVEISRCTATMGCLPLTRSNDALPAPHVHLAALPPKPPLLEEKPPRTPESATSSRESSCELEQQHPRAPAEPESAASDKPLVKTLLQSSVSMISVLRRRLTHLRVLRSLWGRDPQEAMEYIRQLCIDKSDCGVVVDFLVAMQNMRMKERVNVNVLPRLLEVLKFALTDEQDVAKMAALKVFRSMNNKFRAKMEEARRFAASFRAVNSQAPEAIMQQYYDLAERFEEVALYVHGLQERRDALGEEARAVLAELPTV